MEVPRDVSSLTDASRLHMSDSVLQQSALSQHSLVGDMDQSGTGKRYENWHDRVFYFFNVLIVTRGGGDFSDAHMGKKHNTFLGLTKIYTKIAFNLLISLSNIFVLHL